MNVLGFILLTSMLSLRHLSTLCWDTAPQHRTPTYQPGTTWADQLENVQRFYMCRVYYCCQLDHNHCFLQRFDYLKLDSLELRPVYNDMVMVYVLHGHVNVTKNNLIFCNNPVLNIFNRGHGFRLKNPL